MKTTAFFLLLFALFQTLPSHIEAKQIRYEDFVYEQEIRSVQFYKATGNRREVLEYPVTAMGQSFPLMLEFDDLGDEYYTYSARIIHCDFNWERTSLNDIEFIEGFNEYTLTDYQTSAGTRTPYVHYRFKLPKVKLSGNYVLAVYRDRDEEDLIITRRFIVYDSEVIVDGNVGFTNSVEQRWHNQEVKFNINYDSYPLDNPANRIKVLVRQNARWDNAITDLKPLYIRELDHLLDYQHFDLQNNFEGGHEYRFFDIRSIYQRGFGVGKVVNKNNRPEIFLEIDSSRSNHVYKTWPDVNGYFIIENFETQMGDAESEYLPIHFLLKSPKKSGNVYVFGQLSNWRFNAENRMQYDDSIGAYYLTKVLKQGYYNFKYFYQASPDVAPTQKTFEGSHNMTENTYDITVYYRPIGARYDHVIGYTKIEYNKRGD